MGAKSSACDEVELVFGKMRHRQVALDAAPRVEQLRVGDGAKRLGHVVGANPGERGFGSCSDHSELGEGALVNHPNTLPDGTMLLADVREPVLASVGIHVLRRHSGQCEPVRTLPA